MTHYSKYQEKAVFDNINHPRHYNSHPGGVQPIELTQHMSFCLGNVIKYTMRYELKGGLEDLKKARWYLNKEIERLEGRTETISGRSHEEIDKEYSSNFVYKSDTLDGVDITTWEEYQKLNKQGEDLA